MYAPVGWLVWGMSGGGVWGGTLHLLLTAQKVFCLVQKDSTCHGPQLESGPHSPKLGKACTPQWRASTARKKQNKTKQNSALVLVKNSFSSTSRWERKTVLCLAMRQFWADGRTMSCPSKSEICKAACFYTWTSLLHSWALQRRHCDRQPSLLKGTVSKKKKKKKGTVSSC